MTTNKASQIPRLALVLTPLYVVGLALLLTPTSWVLGGYFFYVAAVVLWSAAALFIVFRAPRRVWLIATLFPMAALLIFLSVAVKGWVATGMVP